ncbi:MAG: biopolymer transporter ExbD [Bacteroidota bacterium]
MNSLFTSILALFLLTACNSSDKPEQKNPTSSASVKAETPLPESTARLAIYVTKDGSIFLNEQSTSLKDLEDALKQHKLKGGTVFYSRDDQQQDPPEIALQVIDLIAKYELPIQFYTDKTFTQVVEFK